MAKFQKGQSGNPGGRPKENPEVKNLARKFTPEAINRLVFWMRSNDARASVQSALAIIERGYGKPIQAVDMTIRKLTAKELSDDELADIAAGSGGGAAEAPDDPAQLN